MVKKDKCVFLKMSSIGRIKYKKKDVKKTDKMLKDRKQRLLEWRKW